jgi:hypothetical protein
MNLRLLATPLAATTLLLSTLSCSKKDETTPAQQPIIVASYLLGRNLVNCTASSQVMSTGLGTDYLTLTLTTTPQPATGAQRLRLVFTKNTGQPLATYSLLSMDLLQGNATYFYPTSRATLTSSGSTSVSGTFSGTPIYANLDDDITSGIFTDVPL